MSTSLLDENLKKNIAFLKVHDIVSFLSVPYYTQFNCKSLGDLFAISYRSENNKLTHEIKHVPRVFKINKLLLNDKKCDLYQKI